MLPFGFGILFCLAIIEETMLSFVNIKFFPYTYMVSENWFSVSRNSWIFFLFQWVAAGVCFRYCKKKFETPGFHPTRSLL